MRPMRPVLRGWRQRLHGIGLVILAEGLWALFWSNALSGLVMLLLANSGGWKYFASTLMAHDFVVSAQHAAQAPVSPVAPVLVIAIDDVGFAQAFQARSPLPRGPLLALMQTVQAHVPRGTPLALDIDLSPGEGDAQAQGQLDAFLLAHLGQWIVPAVQAAATPQPARTAAWRQGLCRQGVRFALSYVPLEFGYPKLTHQYVGGLADALSRDTPPCVDPDVPPTQRVMPMSAAYVQTGTLLPYQGDLPGLAAMLDALQPRAVVIGGTWGQSDLFDTPLGLRYGVQLHAAALAGQAQGERLASHGVEVAMTLAVVGILSVLLVGLVRALNRWGQAPRPDMFGHGYFMLRGRAMVFTGLVALTLMGLVQLLSWWHARTGYWIAAGPTCASVILYAVVNWNLGRVEPDLYDSMRGAWRKKMGDPARQAWRSLMRSLATLRGRPNAWRRGERQPSAREVLFDGLWAAICLLVQCVIPTLSIAYLVWHLVMAGAP